MKLDKFSECGGCGFDNRWILHNVRDRGIYRRLCTSCVLKFHSGLFCPVCFEVYDGSSVPKDRVLCLNCPSVSHKNCVSEDMQGKFVCPPCENSSFVFFGSNKKSGSSSSSCNDGNEKNLSGGDSNSIDLNSAKVLVAAAKISSVSMSKAASVARVEAERRVKEAAFSRKRAREAIERVVALGFNKKENEKEKDKEKEKEKDKAVVVNPSAVVNVAPPVTPSPVSVVEQKKKAKGNNSAVAAAVAAQKRIQNQYRPVGSDATSVTTVPVSSNNVREKERLVGLHGPSVVEKVSKNSGASVEKMDEMKGPSPLMACQQLQRSDTVKEKKTDLSNQVVSVQKDKNGLVSTSAFARHPPENSHGIEKEGEKSKAAADSGAETHLIHSTQDALVSK